MRYVLNSAVVTDYGSYEYVPLDIPGARQWLVAGPVISQVGYKNTQRWIARRLGLELPIDRGARRMQPGDEALVVRLKYRLDDVRLKTAQEHDLADEDIELGLLCRIA